jgi:SAM-dependent methyltransferase
LSLEHYPLLAAYLQLQTGNAAAIDTTIHPNDEMLFPGGDVDAQDPDNVRMLYFRNGFEMARTIEQIVRWRFGGFERVESLLDFASGYGRLTRFLLQKLPRERITVSDILAEGVAFQEQQFGVHGIVSATNPADFVCDRRFDVIFAASLFTHLPENTFRAWLDRLASLLNPRGVLIFTTHSVETFDWSTGEPPGDGEFVFVPLPYSRFLDAHDYGNTYVQEPYLRRLATETLGEHSLLRIRRGLSGGQDLCVVIREPDVDFSTLAYDPGPVAMPDSVHIQGTRVDISGWVATRSRDCPITKVEIGLGGEILAELTTLSERPDVAEHFGEETFRHSGWAVSFDLRERPVSLYELVVIRATTACGFEWMSYVGTLAGAAFRARGALLMKREREHAALIKKINDARVGDLLQRIAALEERAARLEQTAGLLIDENDRLRTTIAAMEASRFWKVRRQWFRVKRKLGLTDEA